MKNLTDEKLYELCKHFGERALHYRRKFIGLLPEVNRRKLYKQKGFGSIFEFAFKLGGLSQEQVKRAISLDQNFSDKPVLREVLITGKASINKLARIASIATPENQEFLATQVELLPKKAIETLVRDLKYTEESRNKNVLFGKKIELEFVPGHKSENLRLSPEVVTKLSELQNKGLDINNLILEFLKKREGKIENEKEIESKNQETTKPSRHIPAKIKKILHATYGTKCAISHCQKPAQTIHHTTRFAIAKNHDPHFLAPLCHEHHRIAHTVDLKFNHYAQTSHRV